MSAAPFRIGFESSNRIGGRVGGRRPRRQQKAQAYKARLRGHALEALEPRTLLAIVPAPTVTLRRNLSNPAETILGTNESNPFIAVNPSNQNQVVAVWSEGARFPSAASPINARAAYSNDGGTTWVNLALPDPVFDPSFPISSNQRLNRVTDSTVAFDRFSNFYIVNAQQAAGNTQGAIVLQKYDFRGTTPVRTITDKVVYAWNQDAAIHPYLAVDATLPTFVDPATGATVNNPHSGNVYIGWGTDDGVGSPNTIKIVASSDGGQTFTTRRTVNDEQGNNGLFFQPTAPGVLPVNNSGNSGAQRNTQPRLVVSQGTSDGSVTPGQVMVIWDDFGTGPAFPNLFPIDPNTGFSPDLIRADRIVGAFGQTFTTNGTVRPANPVTGQPRVTTFRIDVDIQNPRFTTVSDIDFRIAIVNPDVHDLTVVLVAPDGTRRQLATSGDFGEALGVGAGGQVFGTVFDEEAITPFGTAAAPHVGNFQLPYIPPNVSTTDFNLSDFYGLNAVQMKGTWQVEVTNNTPATTNQARIPTVLDASLIITSGLNPGVDSIITTTYVNGALTTDTPFSGDKVPFILSGALAPVQFDRGIGPAPAIAADNTRSSYLESNGRIYVAYTDYVRVEPGASQTITAQFDNTDIFLRFSDDGGLTWSNPIMVNDDVNSNIDGFSESLVNQTIAFGRPQFMPNLAVDQTNGTLAVSFYDARHDAQRARAALTVTTSIDGGRTFSPQSQSFVNAPNAPFDQIERNPAGAVLGPIPENLSEGNPAAVTREGDPGYGFGDRQGLAFAGGFILAAWSGNENGGNRGLNLLDVRVARAAVATGPRIIESTMGPVAMTTVDGTSFNANFAPSGAPLVEGFHVRFDRLVDIRTFTPSKVRVFFRRPDYVPTAAEPFGEALGVKSVTPLDIPAGKPFAASSFLVRLDDTNPALLSRTGTYSYAVGPDILDFAGASTTTLTPDPGSLVASSVNVPLFSAVAGLPLPVPPGQTVDAVLDVSGFSPDSLLASIEATLSISVANTGALELYLVGPDNTAVLLSNNRGSGPDFDGTTFSDTAPTPISAGVAPFADLFQPEQPLALLAGKPINGSYKLRIKNEGTSTAQLLAFSVKARTGGSFGNTPLALADGGRSVATLDVAGFLATERIRQVVGRVNITHPTPSQLVMTLIAPDGTRVPFTPDVPLAALVDKPVNGTYRLEIFDTVTGGVGTLNSFRLEFTAYATFPLSTGALPDLGLFNARATITGYSPGQTISKVTVNTSVTHPRTRDLRLRLISPPVGAPALPIQVPLATNLGGNVPNGYNNTTFDDSAPGSITTATAPYTNGTFQPENPLSVFNGFNANGEWTLEFRDTVAGLSGNITSALLTIETRGVVGGNTVIGIPEGANRAVSTLAIGPAATIANVDVTVNINHPQVRELDLYLVAPNGTRTLLSDGTIAGGANFVGTTFSGAAATSIADPLNVAPYTGTFLPIGSFAPMIGGPANGTWQLEAIDRAGNAVAGAIQSWSLNVRTVTTFASTDVPRAIPDNNATGVNSTLGLFALPPGSRIANVAGALEVTLNITHPAVQELDVTLIGPTGATLPLVINGGTPTGGNFVNTTVSNAPGAIPFASGAAPYNSSVTPFPRFLPEGGSLNIFNGTDPNGVWTLRVADRNGATATNIGTLTGWSLNVQTEVLYGQTPSALPANSTVVATLNVTDFPTGDILDEVDVLVSINHPNTSQLTLVLAGPDGTRVFLSDGVGVAGANFLGTIFSDSAVTNLDAGTAPYTGLHRPDEPLAAFAGKSGAAVNGVWRLEVVNNGPSTGTINNFQLALRSGAVLGLLPGPIPDAAIATALIDVTGLPAGEVIDDVEVYVSALHPKAAQLAFTLVAPDGTRITLADGNGGDNPDFIGTIFSDSASRAINDTPPAPLTTFAPFTGRFRPLTPLAGLKGKLPNGTWKLEVQDKVAGDTGTLESFELRIRTRPRFTSADVPKGIPNPGVVTSTLLVPLGAFAPTDYLVDIDVNVDIAHPQVNNLRLTLIAPDGTRMPLVTNLPNPVISGLNFTPTFDDQAAQAINAGTAPYLGRFRTQFNTLSAVGGSHALSGVWTLEVRDSVNPVTGDTPASINSWSIDILPSSKLAEVPLAINDLSQAESALLIAGALPNSVVDGLRVSVSIQHPVARELDLFLIGPNGQRLPLSLGNGGNTANAYLNTTFVDSAAQSITTAAAPFNGSFRPQQPLSGFNGINPNGYWRLLVVDRGTDTPLITEGTLVSWSLEVSTATINVTIGPGNPMDQDSDGIPGEPTDAYAAPRSFAGIPFASSLDRGINGVPFQFPFDPMTLPLIVPGPHVVSTSVPGVPQNVGNLVPDQAVTAFDVTFDRDMNAASFTAADIVRVDGPTGVIGPDSRAAVPAQFRVQPLSARTFRIHFETTDGSPLPLSNSGTYTIVLGPDIRSAAGDLMDANRNAGLSALRGEVDPQNGTTVPVNVVAPAGQVGLTIPAGSVANPSVITSQIVLTDDFLIQDVNLQLDISHTNVPNLEARLIAVDPTGDPTQDIIVLLFAGVGATGTRTDFRGTIFDDQATTPIQNGGPPFVGSFSPQVGLPDPNRPGVSGVSLGFLNNNASARTYLLEITNTGPTAGRLNSWSLTFQKPVPITGLGEPVADRTTTSFRIFNMNPTNPNSSNQWTPVGPAGTGARGPGLNAEVSGRVNAIAVDPSDPSGNTVYAGAASGGIWKTTNFLTTSPTGPTWIPLLDEGPTQGLRIGGITVVGRNNDPNQSIIFAATGDGPALGDPARPSSLTARGVGFLRSTDGGKTWDLLDSRNNNLPFSQRDHFFAAGNGTAAFRIVADPQLTPTGEVIVYAALSDLSANGTDTYTDLILAAGGTVRGGLWRSVDTGRTWQQMRVGQANDVVLDLNSRTGSPDGNVQRIYAAFRNDGIYESPNRGQVWNPMPGVTGVPLIQNADFAQPQPVAVIGPPQRQAFQQQNQSFFTANSNRTTPNAYVTNAGFNAIIPTAAEPSLGRTLLAKPALTGNTLKDAIYQGWLYAAVMVHNQGDLVQLPPPIQPPSNLWGLFVTKDFGQNWTRIMVPTVGVPTNGFDPVNPIGNTSQIDVTGVGTPGGSYYFKGNFSSSLAVDPNNPNVVYFGGTDMFGTTNMVRVDITGLADPHAFYLSNDDPDQNVTEGMFRTYAGFPTSVPGTGPLAINAVGSPITLFAPVPPFPFYGPTDPVTNNPAGAYDPKIQPFINLIRDPARPFQANATILVTGVARFNNTGTKSKWIPFTHATKPDPFLADSTDTWSRATRGFHQILTLRDPLTGASRLIFANDYGVYTAVDEGDGSLVGSIGGVSDPSTRGGNVEIVNGSRNGNLQLAQFRSGAAQPSTLSAQIGTLMGRAMFLGNGEDTGQPGSDPEIVTPGAAGYGNISWVGLNVENRPALQTRESGFGVATQQNFVVNPQTGLLEPGSVIYHFMNPEGLVEADFPGDRFHPSTDFWQANGVSRTFGLVQTDFGGDVPDAQWLFRQGRTFAINPLNGNQAIIGSFAGRVFGTESQGAIWSVIGDPNVLGSQPITALAYGAPLPAPPGGSPNLNDYLLVGNQAGSMFVTFTGGGGTGNQWTNISAGLDGSPIKAIVTNPTSGSFEAYAVTQQGVYRNANTSVPGTTWQNITGNLFSINHNPFGNSTLSQPRLRQIDTIQVDWRYVIPANFSQPNGPTHPLLYVGGNGGVYRSVDNGATWSLFPDVAFNNSPLGAGGGLPNAHVTDLDLSLGLINPTTGRPDVSTGPNLLLASTYGRGQFAIRLAPLVFPNFPQQPRVLGIDSASDSGLSNTDHVTNIPDPFVVGLSEQTAFGNVVYITLYDLTDPDNPRFIGGFQGNPNDPANLANTAIQTDSAGRFRVRINPGALTTDGLKTIGVQATNLSGTEGNMATFEFVLDTTPPVAPDVPNLLLVSDTGLSNNDQITRLNTNLQFRINFASIDAGSRVTLFRNSVAVGTPVQGNSPVDVVDPGPINPDGTYAYRAQLVDLAGNLSPFSPTLNVRVDTQRPAAPSRPTLDAGSDTGVIGDNITSNTRPVFTGTAERNTFPNPNNNTIIQANLIQLLDAAGNVIGSAPVGTNNQYAVQPTNPLGNGSYTFTTRVIDVAGNISDVSIPTTVQILNVTPDVPTLRLVPIDDSGIVGDNITNVRRPRLEGTGGPGLFVQLIDVDGRVTGVAGGVITPLPGAPPVIVANDRTFQIQFPNNLPDNTYTVVARTSDVAANFSDSLPLVLTILTQGPTVQPNLILLPADDTGTRGDNVTSIRRPRFEAIAPPLSMVVLVGPEGILDTRQAGADGKVILQPPLELVNGRITLTARLLDTAGNTGPLSNPVNLRIVTTTGDLDSDGRADLATYTRSNGNFTALLSTGAIAPEPLGGTFADIPFTADLDADGKADFGYFRPSTATWIVQRTRLGGLTRQFGTGTNAGGQPVPVVDDYDGDGIDDLAVFDQLTGTWELSLSRDGNVTRQFGIAGDHPITGDFDGDGKADLVVYRTSTNRFLGQLSTGVSLDVLFGQSGDVPFAADFDGDLRLDPAVFRPSTNQFLAALSTGGQFSATLGALGDIPVVADYDGDGLADVAVFRPGSALWIINQTSNGQQRSVALGSSGDVPIPAPYFPYRAPTTPTLALLPADDTGIPGDNSTTVRRPRFSGTGIAGLSVRLVDIGGNITGTAGALIGLPVGTAQVLVQPNGTFQIQLPNDLPLGTYQIAARTSNALGTFLQSPTISFQIVDQDPVNPLPVPTIGLLPADDTGTAGDGATTVLRPRMTGTGGVGLSVRLVDLLGNITGLAGGLIPLPGGVSEVLVQANGTYQIQFPSNLALGTYQVAARTTNTQGLSNQSPAFVLQILDDTLPQPLPTPALALLGADDTGIKGDGKTSLRRPRFQANTDPGRAVQLIAADGSVLDVKVADASGVALLQNPNPSLNGLHTLRARVVDTATGNVGSLSSPVTIQLVTTLGDLNADGIADLATYRRANGTFRSITLGDGSVAPAPPGGRRGDVPIMGDIDGDGRMDLGYYRPATGTWVIQQSSAGLLTRQFGPARAIPQLADIDGDGRDDLIAFQRNTATWFISQSTAGDISRRFGPGGANITPVVADYDGDGLADLASFNARTATWSIALSSGGSRVTQFGRGQSDIAAPGDFDGDGITDLAVYRPSTRQYLVSLSGGGTTTRQLGNRGDQAVPLDFDGDGFTDYAVFRPRTAQWFIARSSDSQNQVVTLGRANDIPVAAPYRPYRVPPAGAGGGGASTLSIRTTNKVAVASVLEPLPGSSLPGFLAKLKAKPRRR